MASIDLYVAEENVRGCLDDCVTFEIAIEFWESLDPIEHPISHVFGQGRAPPCTEGKCSENVRWPVHFVSPLIQILDEVLRISRWDVDVGLIRKDFLSGCLFEAFDCLSEMFDSCKAYISEKYPYTKPTQIITGARLLFEMKKHGNITNQHEKRKSHPFIRRGLRSDCIQLQVEVNMK